jgi:ribonuclease Z
VVFDQDGLLVTAFAVDHGAVAAPAYGYRIDYQGRSAAVSGDTRFFEPIVDHARGVDVLIHEVIAPEVEMRRAQVQGAAALERIIARHASPEQVGTIFARVKPKLAVYSHIVPSPTTAEDLVAPTRRSYTGPLAVGYDLMTIIIGDTVDVFPRRIMSDR